MEIHPIFVEAMLPLWCAVLVLYLITLVARTRQYDVTASQLRAPTINLCASLSFLITALAIACAAPLGVQAVAIMISGALLTIAGTLNLLFYL